MATSLCDVIRSELEVRRAPCQKTHAKHVLIGRHSANYDACNCCVRYRQWLHCSNYIFKEQDSYRQFCKQDTDYIPP